MDNLLCEILIERQDEKFSFETFKFKGNEIVDILSFLFFTT